MSRRPSLLLIGCGILKKEIRFLVEKNGWPLETLFLDSSLHVNLDHLLQTLTSTLDCHTGREIIVFYGDCHPLMDSLLKSARTFRTMGQNCVEMLLGHELFIRELEQGAYFLLEDWVSCWEQMLRETFGPNNDVMREIVQGDRKYLLALTTPCTRDFSNEAEAAGELVGLPLRWLNVSLDHLESVLHAAIIHKLGDVTCQK